MTSQALIRHHRDCQSGGFLGIRITLYELGLVIWIGASIVSQTVFVSSNNELNTLIKIVQFAGLLLALMHLFLNLRVRFNFLCIIIATGLVFASAFVSERLVLVQALIFILAFQGLSFKNVARLVYRTIAVVCGIIVILALFGVIENYTFYNVDGRERICLGFTYATYIPNYLLTFTLLFGYTKATNYRLIHVILLLLLDALVFNYSETRFVALLTAISAWAFFLLRRGIESPQIKSVMSSGCIRYIFIICCITSITLSAAYSPDNPILSVLDELLSTRLRLGHNGFSIWGVSLLGSPIEFTSSGWVSGQWVVSNGVINVVDSSYLRTMFFYGVGILVLLLLGLTNVMRKAQMEHDYHLVFILAVLAVLGIIEPRLTMLDYTPFLLLLSSCFNANREYVWRSDIVYAQC